MRFKANFHFNGIKKEDPLYDNYRICNGYRTTWLSKNKPEHSTGVLVLNKLESIKAGETCNDCYIEPFAPELWQSIKEGEVISCMTGLKKIGEATVIKIINYKSIYPTIEFPNKQAAEEYTKDMKNLGFEEISIGPSIDMTELKRRRFSIK